MIKSQLGNELRDEDTRRDTFLCLAVSIPATHQVALRDALGPLLARARIKSSDRDVTPEDSPHVLLSDDLQTHTEDLDVPTQLEREIGVASTLLVLGCQCLFNSLLDPLYLFLSHLPRPCKSTTCQADMQ